MTRPQWTDTISTGNVLTILSFFVAAGIAWGTARADIRQQAELLARVEHRIEQARAELIGHESRIRALELGAGRTEEKLINILNSLQRIEAQLNAMPQTGTGR